MKTCTHCGSKIPGTKYIDGKLRHLHKRKRCLKCSPFGSNGPTMKRLLKKSHKTKVCTRCKKCLKLSSFHVKIRHGGRYVDYHFVCKKCWYEKHKHQVKSKKIRAIELLGGKCMDCGYHRSLSALEFHHRNPKLKDITMYSILNHTWGRVLVEIKKCDLLCANCHRERHDKLNGVMDGGWGYSDALNLSSQQHSSPIHSP